VFTGADGLKGVKWCWGDVMIPANYDDIKVFTSFPINDPTSCFVIATKNGQDYLLDYLGRELFRADELCPDYASIIPTRFCRNNKWGIINSAGQIILENKYDHISSRQNGFIFLTLNGKEGFIDPFDNIVEPIFDRIELDTRDYLLVTLNGEQGYLNENRNFTTDSDEAFYSMDLVFE
nr:WG repeat-containing protein [Muribaculaceae bacterium]